MSRVRARGPLYAAVGIVVGWFVILAVAGSFGGKLNEVQKNDNASFLPASAEATRAQSVITKFVERETAPAIVVYQRAGGLTDGDRAKVVADAARFAAVPLVATPLPPPRFSEGGGRPEAAEVVVPFAASGNGDAARLADAVAQLRSIAAENATGMQTHVTGPIGILADFLKVFGSLDTSLLLVTSLVIVVILLLVYRSPVLWAVPLLCVGAAFTLSAWLVYLLARNDVVDLNGQSQGILTVLVFGAGTDYALLLISRYREELHRHEHRTHAMRAALRGAAPAIIASALTVIVSMLCLLLSELNSNRGLGPVAAVGIAATLVTMMTFLPALLLLLGRWIFWPRIPRYGSQSDGVGRGWGRIAELVGRRARPIWVATTLALVALTAGLSQLNANGLAQTQAFTNRPDSVVGQDLLVAHFPAGAGSPAIVVARAGAADGVLAAARGVRGIDPASVTAPAKVVDGMVQVQATLTAPPDSTAAYETVGRLRAAVHAVPGSGALVGGYTAILRDTQEASRRDRSVIIPVVLLVIAVILAVLLRALLAPLLLIGTVVLSFAAALGLSGLLFRQVFHFAGADSAFPLFVFVFLVALGVDYNIFLMTRVREESLRLGTRPGTLRGLAVTGGVITSAGLVLAATFSALTVLPVVFLVEFGTAILLGILLDTIVVRSLLVPALTYDIGRAVWWPGRLARVAQPAPDGAEDLARV
ncbi:MAG: MMPL family transporter [Actinobacteria bacterium]|nr:MMPL family transporter [Actinomycetota bacterium]